jgi:hypothetical protein
VYDIASGQVQVTDVEAVTRVVVTGTTTEVFHTSGGSEVSAGVLAVAPTQLTWTAAGGPGITAPYDRAETHSTACDFNPVTPNDATFTTSSKTAAIAETAVIRTVQYAASFDPDTGDWTRALTIVDAEADGRTLVSSAAGLTDGVTYYYGAFVPASGGSGPTLDASASATATASYGYANKLWRLLPEVHRYYDAQAADDSGAGPLQRFLQVCGAGLDLARSRSQGLLSLHDVVSVDAAYLPRLARWIGWDPNLTLPDRVQRTDVLFAPGIFATVGTVPTLRALVNRLTGWDCQVKEFVDNVFLTNAPEDVRLWQVFEASRPNAATPFGLPAPQANLYPLPGEPAATQADPKAFDARPAAVVDGGGTTWLFWHSHRPGAGGIVRRRIWAQRLGVDAAPVDVVGDLSDDASNVDEAPAAAFDGTHVWLFWSSNRASSSGSLDLWVRSFTGSPASPGAATRLTEHVADDRNPAVVHDAATNQFWLFWESTRRRPFTDVWAMTSPDGLTWSAAQRITTGAPRDRTPAAVLDAGGNLRLFWSAELGDRNEIRQAVLTGATGTSWAFSNVTAPDVGVRDESPGAALWSGAVWLFWHSNRPGRLRIYAQSDTGSGFGAPAPALARLASDAQPAVVAEPSGDLRLLFASQESGARFRSRTVDTSRTPSTGRTPRSRTPSRCRRCAPTRIAPTTRTTPAGR